MNVTRDVVKDLLPVYLAGEASPETRAVVEAWLATDPELRAQADRGRSVAWPDAQAPPPTVEKRALDTTRRRLRRRSILLGTAVYVSTLPLSVSFNRNGFNGLLIDNWPERVVILAIAAALWAFYWKASRRLRVSGI
jgi:anti-sigma factor RsiW